MLKKFTTFCKKNVVAKNTKPIVEEGFIPSCSDGLYACQRLKE